MPAPSGQTPSLHLPYPVPDDPVDVPRDIKALADALELLETGGSGAPSLKNLPILDVGVLNQNRAGRELTLADFTNLGLSAPLGLWSLSNLNDSSGNGRALSNKGAVPFGVGINGLATTAAVFAGSTGQALYIADTGAADPFRIKTGSWGCWTRTAKRGLDQKLICKLTTPGQLAWSLTCGTTNVLAVHICFDGSNQIATAGISDVADDRWHHAIATHDGTTVRLYVDGVLEGTVSASGILFASSAPLNIGAYGADAGTAAAQPHYGRVDEAFVTADVLSEDQIRCLYAAKLTHGFVTAPTSISLNVTRRRKGSPLLLADFATQPLRLHNFTAGSLNDEGSNGLALTNNGTAVSVAGADGTPGGAFSFAGAQSLSASDAGLPAALAARSYGCWFKTAGPTTGMLFMSWGSTNEFLATGNVTQGCITTQSGADAITGPFVVDGQWHLAVVTGDNAAGDGVRRKLYVDGRLVGGSTVLGSLTLAGANRFRIGAHSDGTVPFTGQIDGAFVTGYALSQDEILRLWAKGSQDLGASPKNAGDHVERVDAASVLFIGDTLNSQDTVDLGVVA